MWIALLAGYPAPASIGTQMFAQGTICKMVGPMPPNKAKSIDAGDRFRPIRARRFLCGPRVGPNPARVPAALAKA